MGRGNSRKKEEQKSKKSRKKAAHIALNSRYGVRQCAGTSAPPLLSKPKKIEVIRQLLGKAQLYAIMLKYQELWDVPVGVRN